MTDNDKVIELRFDENKLFTPMEAVDFLNQYCIARNRRYITVDSLRQMRRKGRIKGTSIGGETSRMTVYRLADLLQADVTYHKPGKPGIVDADTPKPEGEITHE